MSQYVRGGISVENPCLFTYNGRWYYFSVTISNVDESVGSETLDNKHVELFEYTNEANSLCLYGSVVFNDFDGVISKYFNRFGNHMTVVCTEMRRVQEGEIEMFYEMDKIGHSFAHQFIVQNIKILKRVKQCVTYQLSLISTAWYSLSSKISFSNYGAASNRKLPFGLKSMKEIDEDAYRAEAGLLPLSEEEKLEEEVPSNGFLMLKKFLNEAFSESNQFKVDNSGFDGCAMASKQLKVPFISNGSDNVFSAVRYVLDHMYWSKKKIDSSLKMIVFDPVFDTYRCLDYANADAWIPCNKPAKLISMFDTEFEEALFSENVELGSVAKKNQTSTYEDLFDHVVWEYDSETGDFSADELSLKTADLLALYNSKPVSTSAQDAESRNSIVDKYPLDELNPNRFTNIGTYYHQLTEWNRGRSIYQNLIDNLMKRDAIVVNSEGDFTHQPGTSIGIILDRTVENDPETSPERKHELEEKYRQFEGQFPVLKVQHRFSPSTSEKKQAYYNENLVIGRNYLLEPKV